MATEFNEIYDSFKRKIEDNVYPLLDNEEKEEYLFGFLQDAIGMIQAEGLTMEHNLSLIDEDMQEFNEDLNYGEKMGISLYMVIAWYEPKINSLEHTLTAWGSKDERWQDLNKHLTGMVSTQDSYRRKARKYFTQYRSKNNSYLRGDNNA